MSEEASVEVPSVQEILQELREADLVQGEAELTALTGGVSCEVWRIRAEDLCEQVRQANPHGLVVKAPLATLRTPSLWRADTSRGFAEAKALELYGRLTPRSVPPVVWRHPTAPVMVVEAAPESWRDWRDQMLASSPGQPQIAGDRLEAICVHLGQTLAAWHGGTGEVDTLPEVLRSGDRLRTLRTDVFHRATAAEVPQIASELEGLAVELETARTCLVHGDYSPKNVLVSPPGAPLAAWMLDAEVAHVGDPALDVAYLSTHLACKAVARPYLADSLNRARSAFQVAYQSSSDLVDEDRLSRHTGAILAARVRGVSRVTYLDVTQESFVLAQACLLVQGQASLNEVWDMILKR